MSRRPGLRGPPGVQTSRRPGVTGAAPAARACLLSLCGGGRDSVRVHDRDVVTDEQWMRIEPLLPPVKAAMGRPCRPHRPVVEGIVYRYRAGIPWRDLPERFGPWQTVWKRHHRWSADGTWDRVFAQVLADADGAGDLDWRVSADSTVVRAHQHATNAARDVSAPSSYTGGAAE
jgi:transposase